MSKRFYQQIEEIYEVADEMHASGYLTDEDYDFVQEQAERVKKTLHMTEFSDEQAANIRRIYAEACDSPY
jgi:hypothetical protein